VKTQSGGGFSQAEMLEGVRGGRTGAGVEKGGLGLSVSGLARAREITRLRKMVNQKAGEEVPGSHARGWDAGPRFLLSIAFAGRFASSRHPASGRRPRGSKRKKCRRRGAGGSFTGGTALRQAEAVHRPIFFSFLGGEIENAANRRWPDRQPPRFFFSYRAQDPAPRAGSRDGLSECETANEPS